MHAVDITYILIFEKTITTFTNDFLGNLVGLA